MSRDITVPPPEQLRADIRQRAAELRDLRRLLRLAEAAEAVLRRKASDVTGRQEVSDGG